MLINFEEESILRDKQTPEVTTLRRCLAQRRRLYCHPPSRRKSTEFSTRKGFKLISALFLRAASLSTIAGFGATTSRSHPQ